MVQLLTSKPFPRIAGPGDTPCAKCKVIWQAELITPRGRVRLCGYCADRVLTEREKPRVP
jgi:hypothetical protein